MSGFLATFGLLPTCLLFIFIFFYGLASGETNHPLWQASSFAMGLMVVALVYVCNVIPIF